MGKSLAAAVLALATTAAAAPCLAQSSGGYDPSVQRSGAQPFPPTPEGASMGSASSGSASGGSASGGSASGGSASGASQTVFTLDTPVQEIVATPGGKAILDQDIPGLTSRAEYKMFKAMSLKQLAPMSGGKLTPAMLTQVQADLARLSAGATGQ